MIYKLKKALNGGIIIIPTIIIYNDRLLFAWLRFGMAIARWKTKPKDIEIEL